MVKKLYWSKKQDLEVLREEIELNNVVICSTDTIYGFLGNITLDGFNRICQIKGVCETRPFLILISRHDLLNKLASFVDMSCIPEKTLKFIQKCWPGPVTFIFKAKGVKNPELFENSPDFLPNGYSTPFVEGPIDFLSGGRATIAIRCPDHVGLQGLLTNFDGLFSTSANKAGLRHPEKFENIDQDLLNLVNYVVLDKRESSGEKASIIIDLSCPDYMKEFPFGLVRGGDFSLEKLQEIYKSVS